jgi:hypothetical protein
MALCLAFNLVFKGKFDPYDTDGDIEMDTRPLLANILIVESLYGKQL